MSHTAQIQFFTLFCSNSLMSQVPSDCITAIDICTKDRFKVFQESSSGTALESLGEVCNLLPFAIDTESNAYWIRYEFITDGNFTFSYSSFTNPYFSLK